MASAIQFNLTMPAFSIARLKTNASARKAGTADEVYLALVILHYSFAVRISDP